ncbi:MAG: dual specificity protein phosphatase family protein [Acidobacteriota bacterium]|nr:dual specificity protein phosphatase family protein [Acidobacteriota bacterium]
MTGPIPDSYWVIENRFLAGEYPGAFDPDEARAKLERFLDHGVNLFIDFTEDWELNAYAGLAKEQGDARQMRVAHERFPIRDVSIPTEEEMDAILARIKLALEAGHTCYVHCWGGVGRTGTVVGCWLVQEEGTSPENAIARIAQWRSDTPDGWKRSPETDEQRAFIERWAART